MMNCMSVDLKKIAKQLVAPGKGILAADESSPTIKKRFDSIGVESTKETRRDYRELLFTTPDIEKFISGVILFDETIKQMSSGGVSIPKLLSQQGIIPGIKVDKGKVPMLESPNEMVTEGIDGLRERLVEYKKLGAKFAKWRAVFSVEGDLPTQTCIDANAKLLSCYAAYCQEVGIVPIVEPEVLMKGTHSIEEFAGDSKKVLKGVFLALAKHKVSFDEMLLKPSWIHPGLDRKAAGPGTSGPEEKVTSKKVAMETLKIFRQVLPDELPGVVFLSGGDSPEDSTSHLDALNELGGTPWQLSFSFGRALQKPALEAWQGKKENEKKAQQAFYERARLNSLARTGDY